MVCECASCASRLLISLTQTSGKLSFCTKDQQFPSLEGYCIHTPVEAVVWVTVDYTSLFQLLLRKSIGQSSVDTHFKVSYFKPQYTFSVGRKKHDGCKETNFL